MELRLIIDQPHDGAWNMSVDEALLESAARGIATLRFYFWAEPTLSLGYFQRLRERLTHSASARLPVVRRTTGGGAIVHDRELTYSFTTPAKEFRSAAATRRMYQSMHTTAAKVLTQLGVPARVWQQDVGPRAGPEPFLCFQRRTSGDVVAEDNKVLGSAQRRARQGLLQHGSLLLATSRAAPEFPGLERWQPGGTDPLEVVERWTRELGIELAIHWSRSQLTEQEQSRAELIQAEKFANSSWTQRR